MSEKKSLRYNEGKPKWSLVDFKSLEPLVRVQMYGADKYSVDNWKIHMEKKDILDSAMRHLTALIDGEISCPESLQLHCGHIMANMMYWNFYHNRELENKKEEKSELG